VKNFFFADAPPDSRSVAINPLIHQSINPTIH